MGEVHRGGEDEDDNDWEAIDVVVSGRTRNYREGMKRVEAESCRGRSGERCVRVTLLGSRSDGSRTSKYLPLVVTTSGKYDY